MDIKDFKDVVCTCGSYEFMNLFIMKVVPALYSQTGKEQLGPFPSRFICANCGKDVVDSLTEHKQEESSIII
jgi:hypothetical protein